ncbi:A disintegrin and metalloproteinase with thrombospondin motifs like [Prorops nasuta]|uniref:A disintegrin and metalloproteinase with thrombospondin motifs like n=1 Tax=Prorops nasuta TaxID=863751 RepID=UPI0034CE480F
MFLDKMFKHISLLLLSSPLLILCNVKLTESYLAAENTPIFFVKSNPSDYFRINYAMLDLATQNITHNSFKIDNEQLYSLEFDNSVRRQRRSAYSGGVNPRIRPALPQDFEPIDLGIHSRNKRHIPDVINPKVLVTVDYHLLSKIGPDVRSAVIYVLSFFLGVNMRYRMLTNPKIRFNVAAIILPEDPLAVPYLANNIIGNNLMDSDTAIYNMSTYFAQDAKVDQSHYDIAITLTDFLFAKLNDHGVYLEFGTAGTAFNRGACSKYRRVGLVQDFGGFNGIYTAAHEIAHLLGANHDGDVDGIADKCERNFLMTPDFSKTANYFEWSSCTIAAIQNFLNSGNAACLFAPLPDSGRVVNVPLPGQLRTVQDQCKSYYGYRAISYYGSEQEICFHLECKPSLHVGYHHFTFSAAEGTPCIDDNHFCLDGHCTMRKDSHH